MITAIQDFILQNPVWAFFATLLLAVCTVSGIRGAYQQYLYRKLVKKAKQSGVSVSKAEFEWRYDEAKSGLTIATVTYTDPVYTAVCRNHTVIGYSIPEVLGELLEAIKNEK